MVLFQEDFPVDFGPDYDAALQVLVLDFLSRLERLLPVPDLQHVSTPASHRPPGLAAPGRALYRWTIITITRSKRGTESRTQTVPHSI